MVQKQKIKMFSHIELLWESISEVKNKLTLIFDFSISHLFLAPVCEELHTSLEEKVFFQIETSSNTSGELYTLDRVKST